MVKCSQRCRWRYLGGEDGLVIWCVAEQRDSQLGGNVTKGRDLIRTRTPSEEDPLRRIMKFLQGEETQTLHEAPLYLRRWTKHFDLNNDL